MAGSTSESAKAYLDGMTALLARLDASRIDQYAERLFEAWKANHSVWVFGNGGSASCASHHVADYVKTAQVEGQRRLRAFSLCDNKEMMTAIGNDIGYDDIFIHPLESYAEAGDVAVAISCSGNSPNVVRALEWAKANGLFTVAITGFAGGKIGAIADLHINVPSDNYGLIEDLQLSVGHIVAQVLQRRVQREAVAA